MATIALSLGTNLGNREVNLENAMMALCEMVKITAISHIYQTEPWGPIQDQPTFYNICALGITDLAPDQLLHDIKELETALGRDMGPRWGPRLIDIDLLFYDNLICNEENLTLPHPRIAERAFVLVPLAEIAPRLIHPELNARIHVLRDAIDTRDVQRLSRLRLS